MNCKNCEKTLAEGNNYCNHCGAKIIRNRLTMKNLFESFSEQFLNYDNKFLQTFITLFSRPEAVIDSYINGTRKKYVNVVSYFAIAVTLSGIFFFIFLKFFPDALDTSQTFAPGDQTAEQIEIARRVNQQIFEYQSLIFFLSIPILAFMSRLVFLKNKKYNYVEHMVISLYAYAQLSIAVIIVYVLTIWYTPAFRVVIFMVLPLQILYYAFVLKRLYALSVVQIILKTLLFFVVLIPVFIIVILLFGIVLYFAGFYDEMIEAEKAKRGVSYLYNSSVLLLKPLLA